MLRFIGEGAKLQGLADPRKILGNTHSIELKLSGAFHGPAANLSVVATVFQRDDAVRIGAIETDDRALYPDRGLLVHGTGVMSLGCADAPQHCDCRCPC